MEIAYLENWKSQTKKGLMTLMVLRIINSKSCYGGGILKEMKSKFDVDVAEGTLYPILKKLKIKKLVMTNWKTKEGDIGAPKKFYILTGEGKLMLKSMDEFWSHINHSMYKVAS